MPGEQEGCFQWGVVLNGIFQKHSFCTYPFPVDIGNVSSLHPPPPPPSVISTNNWTSA